MGTMIWEIVKAGNGGLGMESNCVFSIPRHSVYLVQLSLIKQHIKETNSDDTPSVSTFSMMLLLWMLRKRPLIFVET